MLRADVSVNDIDQVMEAYQVLKEKLKYDFKIIQIKNKLNTLNHISIKGIFRNEIIEEIIFICFIILK